MNKVEKVCKKCGNLWNISRYQIVPRTGYICPKCEFSGRKVSK